VISLAVFDMAGTTVSDGGTVDAAFADALTELGMPADGPRRVAADRVVEQTMGQSKIEVFTRIFGPEQAPRANAAFESAYAAAVGRGEISALPGAADVLGQLRSAGVHTCLTTGFSAGTRDLVLGVLGWTELVDLSLCPADAGRGRPWPDMVWLAMLRLRPDSAADVLVVGDTPSGRVRWSGCSPAPARTSPWSRPAPTGWSTTCGPSPSSFSATADARTGPARSTSSTVPASAHSPR
jgi:phosphoglycolate phosphatase